MIIKQQRLNLSVYFSEGTECKPYHNYNADINQKQCGLSFWINSLVFDPVDCTDHQPEGADKYDHLQIGNRNHGITLKNFR